jgi:hypothetical protein
MTDKCRQLKCETLLAYRKREVLQNNGNKAGGLNGF